MTLPSILIAGLDWPPETFIARLIRGLLDAGSPVTVASAVRPGPEWTSRPGFDWVSQAGWSGSVARRAGRLGAATARALVREPAAVGAAVRGPGTVPARARRWARLAPLTGRSWDVAYFPWNAGAIAHLPVYDRFRGVVVSCRGAQVQVAPHNPRRAAIVEGLRESFRRASQVHCVSDRIAREAEALGLDPAKAVVIRPAVDVSAFRPRETPRDPDGVFRVVSAGALIWRKGYEHALVGLRRWLDRTGAAFEYVILGDGPERDRVLFAAWEMGLAPHVRLAGRVPPDEVRRTLQESDAFLLTSHSEGIANAALEAMACGLPVVTTDCGGMREAIDDGVEGLVVPLRDPDAVALALEDLWRSPERRRAMGAAGRGRVETGFSLDDQIAAFRALFERAAGGAA